MFEQVSEGGGGGEHIREHMFRVHKPMELKEYMFKVVKLLSKLGEQLSKVVILVKQQQVRQLMGRLIKQLEQQEQHFKQLRLIFQLHSTLLFPRLFQLERIQ